MKVHKVTLLVIDFDDVGDGLKDEIENAHYGNDCVRPDVMSIETVDIGEWNDDNPLNATDTQQEEFDRLFPKGNQ